MPIERETLQVFILYILQLLNLSTFGNTADIYPIVHLVQHVCQHITVDQSHSSGDTAPKILEISGEWNHKAFTNHKRKKNRTALNPGTGVLTALTRHLHSFFAWS
jgi:hypothetical protein